jgi:hypothetical protein
MNLVKFGKWIQNCPCTSQVESIEEKNEKTIHQFKLFYNKFT